MFTCEYEKEVHDVGSLTKEVRDSEITISLDHISSLGSQVSIVFKVELSTSEKTILDGIVSSHTGEPLPNDFIQEIKGEIIPLAPKNEYSLRPYGLCHKHIDASAQIFDITLSNKNGSNIEYSNCSITPQFYDCISQDHAQIRDGIMSVDGNIITAALGRLSNGAAKLSRPIHIDYKIQFTEDADQIYLWGIFIDAVNNGEDDMVRLQVIDDCARGVELGLYDQATYDYLCSTQGGVVILKEYDECWIRHLSSVIEIGAPDNAPGAIYKDFKLRILYYCKDATKTDIKVWADYKLTIKDG